MTLARLTALHAAHAFEPAPLRATLHDMHVPFDELTGTHSCEGRLATAVRSGHRVALIGGSGSGKTSVTESVLGPLVEGLAPIPVPVAIEQPHIATDPAEFARHVVGLVRRWVSDGLPRDADRAAHVGERTPAKRSQRYTFAPGWMGAKVELGYELKQAVEDQPVTSGERIAQARQLLDIIESNQLVPVLVLDDTDRWLNVHWEPGREARRSAFFGRVIRILAEDLATAAVVAVHPSYLPDPDYQAAAGFLETQVWVPALPDAAAVARVLSRRAGLALVQDEDSVLDELVTPAACDVLHAHYATEPNVRVRVLQVAHLALTLAVDDSAAALDERHVQAAIAEAGQL